MTQKTATHYPPDVLQSRDDLDVISSIEVRTLDELFRERVRRSSDQIAYSQYDASIQSWRNPTWADMANEVERWQVAFLNEGLQKGDRVAICHRNSIEWIIFDQAALRLGLVVVPLYTSDRADNTGYVLANSRAKLVLFSKSATWKAVSETEHDLSAIKRVLVASAEPAEFEADSLLRHINHWVPEHGQHLERGMCEGNDLASIVYTSGTTGRPKGVMLSHKNMLSNAFAGMRSIAVRPDDHFLSFLPLSHTLERTVGYYAALMAGARVTFNRSIPELAKDLLEVKPTIMVSVPRIFERVHNQVYSSLKKMSPLRRAIFRRAVKTGWHQFERQQGLKRWHPRLLLANFLDKAVGQTVRDKLGGRLRMVVVGGAPLSPEVSKTFISLGTPLLQGYGLTETSPVVSVNTMEYNRPDSIGLPLHDVQVKIMEQDELWVKGDSVMLGYWRNQEATDACMAGEWIKTGDTASIDKHGFIRIVGRIKDILVLANGEKVPPSDVEAAIMGDTLFEQVLVLGEAKSYLSALVVLNKEEWQEVLTELGVEDLDINSKQAVSLIQKRITQRMSPFPGYARIRRVHAMLEEWTVEDGLLTPTLKMKRDTILEKYKDQVDALYAGHGVHRW